MAGGRVTRDKRARPDTQGATLRETQVASVAAGLFSRVALHPLDTIKCRVQYLRGTPTPRAVASFVFRERLRGLYRGLAPALLGVLPFSAVYMPGYVLATRYLGPGPMAGGVAGVVSSVVKCPVDTVKKRLQSGLYLNLFAALRSIAAEGGGGGLLARVRPFYGGWSSIVVYDMNYSMLQFTFLEAIRAAERWRVARVARRRGVAPESVSGNGGVRIGALTGALTSLATEPLDVVRTRMLTQQRIGMQPGKTFYRNWRHCAREIVKTEGPRALFKGSVPRLVTVSVSSALWLGVYSFVCAKLAERTRVKAHRRAEASS